MKPMRFVLAAPALLLLAIPVLTSCESEPSALEGPAVRAVDGPPAAARSEGVAVSGSAVLYASTAVVHSETPTETGLVQRSTAVGRLTGDLDGWLLFHPTAVFDFAGGTLVNTGTQIFAGTVLGSGPVMLHDDEFRFVIDLATGAFTGDALLSRSNDAPHRGGWFECHLDIVGTGLTPEGDSLSDYSGTCVRVGSLGA